MVEDSRPSLAHFLWPLGDLRAPYAAPCGRGWAAKSHSLWRRLAGGRMCFAGGPLASLGFPCVFSLGGAYVENMYCYILINIYIYNIAGHSRDQMSNV